MPLSVWMGVITKIKNAMQHALAKIQRTLMQPEVKQAGKEQVKKKAKESIMDMLAKAKINADRDNRERWEREGRDCPYKETGYGVVRHLISCGNRVPFSLSGGEKIECV